jgi:endogenous inhibitor of DNA gyrase (YacG/DUF329 family)
MTTGLKKTETKSRERRCPTCSRSFNSGASGDRPAGYPFCSERCRLVDLGRWLDEDYKIPTDERQ